MSTPSSRATAAGSRSTADSPQRILPYGSVEDVKRETRRSLELGRDGGYILAPAHAGRRRAARKHLAFIDTCRAQAR